MAWGNNTVDPKELIGMTPDELKASLGKIDAVEGRITEFQTKTTETLNTLLQKFEEKFEESQKPNPKGDKADADLAFLASPNDELNSRINPLARQTTDNTIMLQHSTARERYPKDFEKRGSEIVQRMGKLSAAQQCDPQCWSAMVMMIRGEHASDLELDGAKGNYTFLEPVAAGLRQADAKDGLNGAERAMVGKLRYLGPKEMTTEKFAAGKQRLEKARIARLGSMGAAMESA